MLPDDFTEIHIIQLITAEDQKVIKPVIEKMPHMLPDRIRRPLIPGGVRQGLLRRQHLHKATREVVEFVRLRNMPVQRRGIELREQIHPFDARVDTVRNRDIDQPIFSRQRHRRFGSFTSERKQARASATA